MLQSLQFRISLKRTSFCRNIIYKVLLIHKKIYRKESVYCLVSPLDSSWRMIVKYLLSLNMLTHFRNINPLLDISQIYIFVGYISNIYLCWIYLKLFSLKKFLSFFKAAKLRLKTNHYIFFLYRERINYLFRKLGL